MTTAFDVPVDDIALDFDDRPPFDQRHALRLVSQAVRMRGSPTRGLRRHFVIARVPPR